MPTWPSNIPQAILRDTYGEAGPIGAFALDPVDEGPPQGRRLFTAAVRATSFVVTDLSKTHVTTFEAWFENDLEFGALSFQMIHPRLGISQNFRFANPNEPYALNEYQPLSWELTLSLLWLP